MPRLAIVVSGPVGAGKTELAGRLASALRGRVVRTRQVLADEYHVHERAPTRGRLQLLGDQLDVETQGRWVAEAVLTHTKFFPPDRVVVADAVRQPSQIAELRKLVTPRVYHIHVTASERKLDKRYQRKQQARQGEELPSFAQVRANPTEAQIETLAGHADVRINTRWPKWVTFTRAYVRVQLAGLWWNRSAIARYGGMSAAWITLIVVVLVVVPALIVTAPHRVTTLAVVYALLALYMLFVVGWALSDRSPGAGLGKRNSGRTNRGGDEEPQ